MPVLSIIACDMLEDELAYVLSKDSELEQLILVEKMECFGLQRKLKSLGCFPALIPLDRVQEILRGEKNGSLPTILKPVFALRFIEKIKPVIFAPDSSGYYGIGKSLEEAFSIGKRRSH